MEFSIAPRIALELSRAGLRGVTARANRNPVSKGDTILSNHLEVGLGI